MKKNWLIVSHGSDSDGFASIKKFTGTEDEAKQFLMKEIEAEREEYFSYGQELDFGTADISELTNEKVSTNAAWYGYSVYYDCHSDFMLYDMDNIEEVK